jgi:hypothetical protein
MSIDITAMDPIVFSNTYYDVEQKALAMGADLSYDEKSDRPFVIRCFQSGKLWASFKTILDADTYMNKIWPVTH